MTSRKVVVHCTFCDTPYNYDFTTEPRMWCNKCNKQFRFKSQLNKKEMTSQSSPIIPKSTQKPSISDPPRDEMRFVDDPNELLMSVAIRELNKPNPDPRWANILISCKKENITIKNEMLEQFKQLPTRALVSLLSKSSPEE